MVKLLLQFEPDVNSKDILGRTPLYFALMQTNSQMSVILFINEASPWSSSRCNYNDIDMNLT